MPERGFGSLEKLIDNVANELSGTAKEERLKIIGKLTEPDIDQAVGNDYAIGALSGWRRQQPIQVVGHSELSTAVKGGIWMSPGVKAGAWKRGFGPMRVMQDGRKASLTAKSGRLYREAGLTKKGNVKRRTVKRGYGATKGRDTWDDAEKIIKANIGKRVHEALVLHTLKKYVGKG